LIDADCLGEPDLPADLFEDFHNIRTAEGEPKAICGPVNFDLFMVLPCPAVRITHAAKLEISSKDRSDNREEGHLTRRTLVVPNM